ncbi:MAG: ABC transporter permease [Synergistaceae bacterium]|jgi:peptide/nickel transport system permease protein|nr:ABC transporter permease [Synergistaceae bacterium]
MIKYIVRRLLLLIPIMLAVSFIVFTLLYITPGDPVKMILGESSTPEAVAAVRAKLGLDQPFFTRYLNYLNNLIRLDMGISYVTGGSVAKEIFNCVPYTLHLAFISILLAVVVGIPIGVVSAVKQYTTFDNVVMVIGLVGISMPVFWLGLLLILFFSVNLKILPSSGINSWAHMILPAITVGAQSIAVICRMTRSSMLEVIRQDYIRTVRAKGQTEFNIVVSHTLHNAMIPIITVIGLQFGALLGGAIMAETIFSIPGVGRLMVDSIKQRDYPIVQGVVLFVAISFSLVNLLIDIIYAFIDPKIRSKY